MLYRRGLLVVGRVRAEGFQHFSREVPVVEALPSVVQAATNDDEVVRRDDDDVLPAVSSSRIRALGYVIVVPERCLQNLYEDFRHMPKSNEL